MADCYGNQDRFANQYAEALLKETERRVKETALENNAYIHVPTVYIGGGTPSVLGEKGIAGLLGGLKAITGGVKEITVEANPETAGFSFLESCAINGVTRLSLGLQSFDETLLKTIGRRGRLSGGLGIAMLQKRLLEAKDIFGRGLSLDLMSGLPGQSIEMLLCDIEKALSFNPGHISLYALTVEEGTPLALRSKKINAKKKDYVDELWIAGKDFLKEAGFEQYEVSNFAISPACRCIHNTRYWLMKNWLGIGPAASGTIMNSGDTGIRVSYPPDIQQFVFAVQNGKNPPLIFEKLDRKTILKETFLMGYRYCEGPDANLFLQRFGTTIEKTIPKTLDKWQKRAAHNSMQETIMNFLNAFLVDAFLELDN